MSTTLRSQSDTLCSATTQRLGFLRPCVSLAVLIIACGPMGARSHAQLISESSGWLNNLRPPTPFVDGSSSFTYSEPTVTQYRASGYTAAADVSIQGTATSLQVPNTTSSPAYRLSFQGPGVAIVSGNSSALVANQGATGGWPYSYSRASATGGAGYWNGFQQVTVASWGSYVEVRAGQTDSDSGTDMMRWFTGQQRSLDIGANPSVRAVNAYPSATSAISSANASTAWSVAFVPGNTIRDSIDNALKGSVHVVPFDPQKPAVIQATFQPNYDLTLQETAALCDVDHFNWVQWVTSDNDPARPTVQGVQVDAPYLDPPHGGYDYQQPIGDDMFDGYWNETSGELASYTTSSTLTFLDAPGVTAGALVEFKTALAGVDASGKTTILGDWFDWKATSVGVSVRKNTDESLITNPGITLLGVFPVESLSSVDIAFLNSQGIAVIPEPSTFILLGIGAVSLVGYVWGRRMRMA
jgi:hypothetical protein